MTFTLPQPEGVSMRQAIIEWALDQARLASAQKEWDWAGSPHPDWLDEAGEPVERVGVSEATRFVHGTDGAIRVEPVITFKSSDNPEGSKSSALIIGEAEVKRGG